VKPQPETYNGKPVQDQGRLHNSGWLYDGQFFIDDEQMMNHLFHGMFPGDKRTEFKPDLIHLLDYERKLLYQREYGLPPIPVQPIPIGGPWSEAELQAMKNNRAEAHEILGRIFPDTVNKPLR
jgi:hypothetical protein